jgi:FkbM family methyltransferase
MSLPPEKLIRLKFEKGAINFRYLKDEVVAEPEVLNYIDRLPENSVFYDLGANVGYFSLYAAMTGKKVYSFEPFPPNFDGLRSNINENEDLALNISPFKYAISDTTGMVNLNYQTDDIGSYGVTMETDTFSSQSHKKSGKVAIMGDTLDNIKKKHDLPYPDHLKVDIDGSEYVFLRNSHKCLKNAKSIMIELYTGSEYYTRCCRILGVYGFSLMVHHIIEKDDYGDLVNAHYEKS